MQGLLGLMLLLEPLALFNACMALTSHQTTYLLPLLLPPYTIWPEAGAPPSARRLYITRGKLHHSERLVMTFIPPLGCPIFMSSWDQGG
eukprot:12264667-Karenia_brevis.AAC.1